MKSIDSDDGVIRNDNALLRPSYMPNKKRSSVKRSKKIEDIIGPYHENFGAKDAASASSRKEN